MDVTDDGYLSLMSDDGNTRDDLKLTENCSHTTVEAVRELLASAEKNGDRVLVSLAI